jgi:riboflavin biosynthesis pyrimidine reductase
MRLDHPGLIVREPADWQYQPRKYIYTRMSQSEVQSYFPDDSQVKAVAPANRIEWDNFLQQLANENVMALLLEGGGSLAAAALQNRIADEVEFHIAPKLLTGANSRPVVAGCDPVKLAEALDLDKFTVRRAGRDVILSGKVKYKD